MTNQYDELTLAFETKLQKLILEYKTLQEKHSTLLAEFERKQKDLMHAHHDILTLQKKYDHLQIANSLRGIDEDEKNASKQRIIKLVREIDKCLALLDE